MVTLLGSGFQIYPIAREPWPHRLRASLILSNAPRESWYKSLRTFPGHWEELALNTATDKRSLAGVLRQACEAAYELSQPNTPFPVSCVMTGKGDQIRGIGGPGYNLS